MIKMSSKQANIQGFQEDLLAWYRKSHRAMPWRASYGGLSDPYHVWLSEIMLQQTTVVTVIDYFQKFTNQWPRIQDLADADLDDVLAAWAGLGYYARARNLHKTAKIVANELQGTFPRTEQELLNLPGVGPYTAAAIASIAFNQQATVLDGNVERVVSRLFKIKEPLPKSKPIMMERAQSLGLNNPVPSAYSQAMMELGAMVCKPKKPVCDLCPVSSYCNVSQEAVEIKEQYPFKEKKKPKPKRDGIIYWVYHPETKHFLIRQRGDKGLFAKMMELPSVGWEKNDSMPCPTQITIEQPLEAKQHKIKHVFTHFELHLDLVIIVIEGHVRPVIDDWRWHSVEALDAVAFPTLMRKAINKAILSI